MTEMNEREYWNQVSSNYFSHGLVTPFLNEESRRLFDASLAELRSSTSETPNSALELGCGNGYFLPTLFHNAYGTYTPHKRVAAVDSSTAMIRNAQKTALEQHLPVSFCSADITQLPFKNVSFDEVFAINSFLMTQRECRQAAFAEAWRVLTPGGRFYGLFPRNENYLEQAYLIKERYVEENGLPENEALQAVYQELAHTRRYDPIGGFIDIPDSSMRIKLYSLLELEKSLRGAGFTDVVITTASYPASVSLAMGIVMGSEHSSYRLCDWLVRAEKKKV